MSNNQRKLPQERKLSLSIPSNGNQLLSTSKKDSTNIWTTTSLNTRYAIPLPASVKLIVIDTLVFYLQFMYDGHLPRCFGRHDIDENPEEGFRQIQQRSR